MLRTYVFMFISLETDVLQRVTELKSEEVSDLFTTAVAIATRLERHVGASAVTYALQVRCELPDDPVAWLPMR